MRDAEETGSMTELKQPERTAPPRSLYDALFVETHRSISEQLMHLEMQLARDAKP